MWAVLVVCPGGLQLFVPLVTGVLLMLYDSWVYHVGDKGTNIIANIPESDVATLNMLQVVGASENVYYSDWSRTDEVARYVRRGLPYRDPDPTRLVEATSRERKGILAGHMGADAQFASQPVVCADEEASQTNSG